MRYFLRGRFFFAKRAFAPLVCLADIRRRARAYSWAFVKALSLLLCFSQAGGAEEESLARDCQNIPQREAELIHSANQIYNKNSDDLREQSQELNQITQSLKNCYFDESAPQKLNCRWILRQARARGFSYDAMITALAQTYSKASPLERIHFFAVLYEADLVYENSSQDRMAWDYKTAEWSILLSFCPLSPSVEGDESCFDLIRKAQAEGLSYSQIIDILQSASRSAVLRCQAESSPPDESFSLNIPIAPDDTASPLKRPLIELNDLY